MAVAAYDKSMLAMKLRAACERVSTIQPVLRHKSSATTASNRYTLRGTRGALTTFSARRLHGFHQERAKIDQLPTANLKNRK